LSPSKIFLAALVAALVAVLACGSSSSNSPSGGPGGFPFTGPSCPPGTQANLTSQTGACAQCIQSRCDQSCVVADCSAYYTCVCACPQGDSACQQKCSSSKLTASCTSCFAGIEACFFQVCGAVCFGGLLDAGSG
jgi:hypothetical protein